MRSPKAGSTFDGGELRAEHDPLKAGTCCAIRADEWGFFGLFGGGGLKGGELGHHKV